MSDNLVRAATPADAPFLAWVMQEADRMGGPFGSTDLIFDFGEPRRLEFLARVAVSELDSYYHHRRFLVAEEGGVLLGALAGYVPDQLPPGAFEAVVRHEASRTGWADPTTSDVLERGPRDTSSNYFRVAIPGDALRVEWVATKPESRGRGVNRRLLQALLESAAGRGLRAAYVGTAIGNEPAIAAYRSAGFQLFAECRHADFEEVYGRPGLVFFRRSLEHGS
jgi:ribosomal protein S18 acetylase RimI-like enzyme